MPTTSRLARGLLAAWCSAGAAACDGSGGPSAPRPAPAVLDLERESAHFVLRYNAPSSGLMAGYEAALEGARDRIAADLGVAALARIEGRFHPDAGSFTAATGYRATGSVDGPARFHVVAIPYSPETAVHELVHNVTLHLQPAAAERPLWLWEAVAVLEAGQVVPPSSVPCLAEGRFPALAAIGRAGDCSIYRVGGTVAEAIVGRWGLEGLRRLVVELGDPQAALGAPQAELEATWHAHVRARLGASP